MSKQLLITVQFHNMSRRLLIENSLNQLTYDTLFNMVINQFSYLKNLPTESEENKPSLSDFKIQIFDHQLFNLTNEAISKNRPFLKSNLPNFWICIENDQDLINSLAVIEDEQMGIQSSFLRIVLKIDNKSLIFATKVNRNKKENRISESQSSYNSNIDLGNKLSIIENKMNVITKTLTSVKDLINPETSKQNQKLSSSFDMMSSENIEKVQNLNQSDNSLTPVGKGQQGENEIEEIKFDEKSEDERIDSKEYGNNQAVEDSFGVCDIPQPQSTRIKQEVHQTHSQSTSFSHVECQDPFQQVNQAIISQTSNKISDSGNQSIPLKSNNQSEVNDFNQSFNNQILNSFGQEPKVTNLDNFVEQNNQAVEPITNVNQQLMSPTVIQQTSNVSGQVIPSIVNDQLEPHLSNQQMSTVNQQVFPPPSGQNDQPLNQLTNVPATSQETLPPSNLTTQTNVVQNSVPVTSSQQNVQTNNNQNLGIVNSMSNLSINNYQTQQTVPTVTHPSTSYFNQNTPVAGALPSGATITNSTSLNNFNNNQPIQFNGQQNIPPSNSFQQPNQQFVPPVGNNIQPPGNLNQQQTSLQNNQNNNFNTTAPSPFQQNLNQQNVKQEFMTPQYDSFNNFSNVQDSFGNQNIKSENSERNLSKEIPASGSSVTNNQNYGNMQYQNFNNQQKFQRPNSRISTVSNNSNTFQNQYDQRPPSQSSQISNKPFQNNQQYSNFSGGDIPYGQPPYGQPPYGQPPSGQPPHGQPPSTFNKTTAPPMGSMPPSSNLNRNSSAMSIRRNRGRQRPNYR